MRKQDAVATVENLGADKVLVLGHIKGVEYKKALIDATDGKNLILYVCKIIIEIIMLSYAVYRYNLVGSMI